MDPDVYNAHVRHADINRAAAAIAGSESTATSIQGIVFWLLGSSTSSATIRYGVGGRDEELRIRVRTIQEETGCLVRVQMARKVGGIAVNIGARVAAEAGPGEVLVSSTVRDLVAGSGIQFRERGVAELKGIPGEWRLFAVESTD